MTTNEPINESTYGTERHPAVAVWTDTEALEELEHAPRLSIEEIRLQCLEMVFRHGRPALGNSNEINPIVAREKIRELARFFEDYVSNG